MSDKNEKIFDRLCSGMRRREPRDLWPGVRAGIVGAGGPAFGGRSAWVIGFAAASVMLLLSMPGVAQNIKNMLTRVFSSKYTVVTHGGGRLSGNLVSIDGEMRELRSGRSVIRLKLASVDANSVKVEAKVYEEMVYMGKPELKLIAAPVVVSMIGKPLEIKIGIPDNPGFILKMTPSEREKKDYSAVLLPQFLPETLSGTDALHRGILDVEAMYWAWRISKKVDAPYEKVEKYICRWDIEPSTREELLKKIRELVAAGTARPLTPAEEKRMKAFESELFRMIKGKSRYSPDLRKKMLKCDKLTLAILDVEAMYWAWQIEGEKNATYPELEKNSESWVLSPVVRSKLWAKVRDILSAGRARELTPSEQAQHDEKIRKQRELFGNSGG